ncbi:MAG: flagellar basal body rod protein FlgB [Planctomycetes bacterium]|nr:flagellar basal body rod protein FlgB [Planctomycetota bacterium]
MMDELSREMSALSKLMDATTLRTQVIAHNMANVDTPGFKRSQVVFEKTFKEILQRGDQAALQKLKAETELDEGGEIKADGNNVHMEDEISDLVKTTALYNTLTRLLSGKIDAIKLAIRGH